MTEHDQESGRATPGAGGMVNTGISITGGTISGVVAGGQNAQVTVNQGAPSDDRLARIDQLLRQLEAGADTLAAPAAQQVRDDAIRVHEELHHKRPDTGRVRELLARLSALVAPASALLDLVNQVKDLIH
jgi:hypothetical protein